MELRSSGRPPRIKFSASLAGILCAFLVNDAICFIMTPIVIEVVRWLSLR